MFLVRFTGCGWRCLQNMSIWASLVHSMRVKFRVKWRSFWIKHHGLMDIVLMGVYRQCWHQWTGYSKFEPALHSRRRFFFSHGHYCKTPCRTAPCVARDIVVGFNAIDTKSSLHCAGCAYTANNPNIYSILQKYGAIKRRTSWKCSLFLCACIFAVLSGTDQAVGR